MLSIDWATRIISVPKADLTLIQDTPTEIRELNLNNFRLSLKNIEDSEEGIIHPDTHRHNTEVDVGGLTLVRVVELINGYTITFEDGQYAVNLVGANSNIGDNVNVNQVSVRSFNSAGLQVVTQGSGVTEQDKLDIADRVWDEAVSQHQTGGTTGEALEDAGASTATPAEIADAVLDESLSDHQAIETVGGALRATRAQAIGRWKLDGATKTLTIYDVDNETPIVVLSLLDEDGKPTLDGIYERMSVG